MKKLNSLARVTGVIIGALLAFALLPESLVFAACDPTAAYLLIHIYQLVLGAVMGVVGYCVCLFIPQPWKRLVEHTTGAFLFLLMVSLIVNVGSHHVQDYTAEAAEKTVEKCIQEMYRD